MTLIERPGGPTIRVLPDPDAASAAAAERIVDALRDAVARRGRADWATTGGSTPGGIYRALASAPLRSAVPWDAVHVWWGDDRFVPRDHPLSNVLPFDQILLATSAQAGLSGFGKDGATVEAGAEAGIIFRPYNVHAMRMTEAIAERRDPAWVASDYERELRAHGLPTTGGGFPIFDVVLAGVGPDGHVFSVFPDSELFETERWVSGVPAPTHVEPHVARVSMHPTILQAAALPLVVVHGTPKAGIVGDILDGPERVHQLPAQVARRPGAVWLLDESAAARLQR